MTLGTRILSELRGDKAIWGVVFVLSIFSILAVYSSTGMLAHKIAGGNVELVLFRHLMFLGSGLFIIYMLHLMHYQRFNQIAPYLMLLAAFLLIGTLVFGVEINSAKRWFRIPLIGLTFQTSDFARLALVIFVAREISNRKEYINDLKSAFLPIILPVIGICLLIAPEDLSTAMMLFLTAVVMMIVGRVSYKYILLLGLLGLVGMSVLVLIGIYNPDVVRLTTWITRLNDFVYGQEGYQVLHSKIAIANGELIGNGPGNSVMRDYLPSPYADFIYAIICEEYGVIGGIMVMSMYVLLFFRVARLVTKSQKAFGAMVAMGLTLNIVIQAMTNMAVSVNLVPVTGLTLPLVSKGGTSLIFTCIAFGIILSVSRHVEQMAEQEAAAR